MAVRATSLAAAMVAALSVATPAAALGPLPWCFTTDPFSDFFILWPKPTGGGQRAGSGLDLAGNRAMSVSTVNQSGQFTIGYTIYPQPGFDPVFGGATVNALTGSGTGECFAPGLLDCGEFTIQKVSCSLAATRQPRAGTGRVMGKR